MEEYHLSWDEYIERRNYKFGKFHFLIHMEVDQQSVSIIIPTYNEERIIQKTLEHIFQYIQVEEIIVVDGNSADSTRDIIKNNFPMVNLIHNPKKGRALQMNLGASNANGDILFFLHADSFPPIDAMKQIQHIFGLSGVIAASFYIRFDQIGWMYQILSFLSRWNTTFATYGDQGLLIKKSVFEDIKGFRPIPIFEDLEIQTRLRRKGRFVKISRPIITSSRRFRKNGLLKQLMINLFMILAWRIGFSPMFLSRYYTYSRKFSKQKKKG